MISYAALDIKSDLLHELGPSQYMYTMHTCPINRNQVFEIKYTKLTY